MKRQLKTFLFITFVSILLLLSLIAPNLASADGMIMRPDPYSDRWDYLSEGDQQALINYEAGLEKMILSISMKGTSENAVWIFPVPANPDKVVIDVVSALPRLSGEEITQKAKSNLLDIRKFLQASQIYTISFIDWFGTGIRSSNLGMPGALESVGMGAAETDIVIHEHLEKKGITTEIITAKTAQALYQYLQTKNLKIEQGSIPVLDHYIGKEFTFIVSWISQETFTQPGRGQQRGIFVTFPTQEIYYPLLLTSVYESEIVPATIRIIGHRSPKIFKDIKSYTETEYLIDNYFDSGNELETFYNGPNKDVKYTKIEINAPSKFLTDDLWINLRPPIKTYYSSFIAQYPFASGIILLMLSSMITGIIVGLILFKDLRNGKNIIKLAFIGLSNCLSIIGVLVVTVFVRTKKQDENVVTLLNEIKQKGYIWKRRFAALLLIVGLPLLIFLFWALALSAILTNLFSFRTSLNLTLIISIVVLVLALKIKRIKSEDKPLFDQLKSNNYSSWSFYPKDKMKFVFVPLFSISFLGISWLIIKLIEAIL